MPSLNSNFPGIPDAHVPKMHSGGEFVDPTAQQGTAISIAKIFYWSIEPKNHEFVGTNRPTDFNIPRFSINLFE